MRRRNKSRSGRAAPAAKASPRPAGNNPMPQAYQLLQSGQLPAAEQVCRTVLGAEPANADAHHCLGAIQQRLGHPEQAVPLFERTLQIDPGFIPAYQNLANSLAQLGRMDDAKRIVDQALSLRPKQAIANRALGDLAYRVSEFTAAEGFFRRALAAERNDVGSQVGLGMTLRRLGRLNEALACYARAARLQPGDASIALNQGNLLSAMGRIDEAVASYRQSIRLRPDHARTHQLLAGARKHTAHDADLQAAESLYNKPGISDEDRMHLAFGLGKAFEDLREYDAAFDYFREGNRIRRSLTPYSISEDEDFFRRLRTTFDDAFFARHQDAGSRDETPILVLGMPRSGTSLVEQILASHPDVHGAGELPDLQVVCKSAVEQFPDGAGQLTPARWQELAANYLRRLRLHDAAAARITDKMPANFQYIGMFATMFPKAKIVHCRRDPMDTCWSIFKTMFAAEGLQWSYALDDLGRYYALYRRLMAHWQRLLPGRILDLQYEDLVADPEPQIRGLLDFCGLAFDPACLSHHTSKRAVETASFAQVRQPIYNSSVQLWRHYAAHLQPLLQALESH